MDAIPPAAEPVAAPPAAATPLPSAGDPEKRAYPAPAAIPTQAGPHGIRFDFNEGARVALPQGETPWQVTLRDLDTGNVLFDTTLKAGFVNSASATTCASASKCGAATTWCCATTTTPANGAC